MTSNAGRKGRIAVLVSAGAEWRAVRGQLPDGEVRTSPYGEWLTHRFPDAPDADEVVFLHGGCGKVAAAGSTQYAIDRFAPRLLLNLGTCGGFGDTRVGDVLLASETVIYDIVEQMGDPDQAIADYTTKLDVTLWPAGLRDRVRVERLLSADRDIVLADLPRLRDHFRGVAADWESGAIAWVGARNQIPTLILRGVTDVMSEHGN
ncbi:MAG: 5'-methylthioadenosine/S-adenosylhomocysteine nucleosidase [Rhizomicrobium sp.]